MIYNGEIEIDKKKALERLKWLISKGKRFELTEKRKRRSLSQNNYLHLILSYYAIEMGESLEYVKQEIFKKQICSSTFKYERINHKTGEIRLAYRSTAELNTKEITTAINKFKNHAAKDLGLYLPDPHNLPLIDQMENEIEKQKQYL